MTTWKPKSYWSVFSGTPCIYDLVHGIKKNFKSVIWVEKGCCGAKIGTIKKNWSFVVKELKAGSGLRSGNTSLKWILKLSLKRFWAQLWISRLPFPHVKTPALLPIFAKLTSLWILTVCILSLNSLRMVCQMVLLTWQFSGFKIICNMRFQISITKYNYQ